MFATAPLEMAGDLLRQSLIVLAQLLKLLIVKLLEIEQRIASFLRHVDELVELDLHGAAVSILRILDHEHHEEGDERGCSVDDELPSVAITEQRTCEAPDEDRRHRQDEGDGPARDVRDIVRKARKPAWFCIHRRHSSCYATRRSAYHISGERSASRPS